jgi:hypothetical protein
MPPESIFAFFSFVFPYSPKFGHRFHHIENRHVPAWLEPRHIDFIGVARGTASALDAIDIDGS